MASWGSGRTSSCGTHPPACREAVQVAGDNNLCTLLYPLQFASNLVDCKQDVHAFQINLHARIPNAIIFLHT